MAEKFRLYLAELRERLWVKPLIACILSIIAALIADMADEIWLGHGVPNITQESAEDLLKIIAASMLVIATFAVASMVAAYASTGNNATPRAFPLIIADDVSQNALSTFIGAFIFSIVALTALMNSYYGRAGRFTLFVLALLVLGFVIFTFLRWVDRIARLGRLGAIIDRVEAATAASLHRRRCAPRLRGMAVHGNGADGHAIYAEAVGYVQHIDMAALQKYAEESQTRIVVAALPGTFTAPGRALAYVHPDARITEKGLGKIASAFLIRDDRRFDDDPRFGLVVLSEIASRALSPAVNDPGTAIDIIGTYVRLFVQWAKPLEKDEEQAGCHDRVEVPSLYVHDMFDDAFSAIARDGAGMVEVCVRLLKGLDALARIGDPALREAAIRHGRLARERAEDALSHLEDLKAIRNASAFCNEGPT
ncbi:DUF2254 domain-containing protein [Oxalobacteraceae bacterium R-40]|uniref:DUF2254 domain-containing protein n=1 Tax=Keguizhuia sedimenti TaxID=3064264 RepID=A0ABU1BSE0_9BURK|nr:DUF2254 domain-containing protein [Oxalobacteraceae bacterium R-40]